MPLPPDRTSVALVASVMAMVASLLTMYQSAQVRDNVDQLDRRAEWMIRGYLVSSNKSKDRFSRSGFVEWQSSFCARNGLVAAQVPRFEHEDLGLPFPPVSKQEWQRVVEEMISEGEINSQDVPEFMGGK